MNIYCFYINIIILIIGPYYGQDMYSMTTSEVTSPNGYFSDDFHTWTLEWTPDGFKGLLDGIEYFNVSTDNGYWEKGKFDNNVPGSFNPWQYGNKDAPFDQEYFFVINLAAGM